MQRQRLMQLAVSLALAMSLLPPAHGQASADQNAAIIYQRAIEQLNHFRESSPDMYEALMNFDPAVPANAQVRAALDQVRPILDIARQGATLPSCQFPLNRDDGLNMLMPHLSQMRQIARVMRADALVRLHDGDASGAAASTADLYRISNHFNSDGTIISSLVGNAIFALGDRTAQYGVDRGFFGEAEAHILQDGLQRLSDLDPFAYARAVAGEKDMFGGWIRNRLAQEEEPGRVMAELMGGISGGNVDLTDHPLLLMTRERFEHELDLYDGLMGRMVEVFQIPDRDEAMAAMAKIEDEIEAMHISSEYGGEGVLVGMLMPALGKAMEMRNRGEKMMAERRAMLGALATGKASPRDFANAAIWYLRAIAMLEKTDPAILKQIRDLAADGTRLISAELANALQDKSLQDAIDTFREGSLNGRCDFSIARQARILELSPSYVAGMHDGFRLLHADAIRLVRAGETERAIDLLTTCIRMAGHLGGDPVMLSSLTAHCNFNRTVDYLKSALHGIAIEQYKPSISEALRRVEAGDPFGYVKSASATRDEIAKRFLWLTPSLSTSEDRAQREREIAAALQPLSADQILHLLIVFDALGRNAMSAAEARHLEQVGTPSPTATENSPEVKAALLARLDDIFSLKNLELAQADGSRMGPLLYQGELNVFDEYAPPGVASSTWGSSLAEHIRRAPRDIRSARAMVN